MAMVIDFVAQLPAPSLALRAKVCLPSGTTLVPNVNRGVASEQGLVRVKSHGNPSRRTGGPWVMSAYEIPTLSVAENDTARLPRFQPDVRAARPDTAIR